MMTTVVFAPTRHTATRLTLVRSTFQYSNHMVYMIEIIKKMIEIGLEPITSSLEETRSIQLSYTTNHIVYIIGRITTAII